MRNRHIVKTISAPGTVGPYSQAVVSDRLVFVSGQIALNPITGKLLDGDIQVQTRQVLDDLEAVLIAAGSTLSAAVKTTVYLTSMADFSAMNDIYVEYFGDEPPAHSTVAVAQLGYDALVEIDVIAELVPKRFAQALGVKIPQYRPIKLQNS